MIEIAYLNRPTHSLRMVQIGESYAVQTLRHWMENGQWKTLYENKTRDAAVMLLESYA